KLGKHLLCRLVADVAGVEDDHVGAFRRRHGGIAQRRQHIRHPSAVVHVHLATPGDDVQALVIHQTRSAGPCRTSSARGAGGIVNLADLVKRDSADSPSWSSRSLAGKPTTLSI